MLRNLVLVRHTKSSWAQLGLADIDRPLKKDRESDASKMGAFLHQQGFKPDLVYCSPALRTRQTASLLCPELGFNAKHIQFDIRIYESTPEEILEVIRETDSAIQNLLVIGHNPSLTMLAHDLSDKPIEHLPTTGTVWITLQQSDWQLSLHTKGKLKLFARPKELY